MQKVIANKEMLKYLPDSPDTTVTKDYLLTIINSLDVGFFPKVVDEIEQIMPHKPKHTNAVVEISPGMYETLKQISYTVKIRNSKHSLKGMVKGARTPKRTRKD